MYDWGNCIVKKVPKKVFFVQMEILPTFGLVKHTSLGRSTHLFTFTPHIP